MIDTAKILEKAKHSAFHLKLLNVGLARMIPFNKPHRFKIDNIADFSVTTSLPYRRKNLNHIRGLHACALATLSEFTTGVLLISKLDPSKFRIILQRLEVDYHYQGKMNAVASFEISEAWLKDNVYVPLESSESTIIPCEIKINDEQGNHLTTAVVHWQIKAWDKVRTKA
ncbi:MAG: DUF4442 domain-containing protein [Bacteroidota bacterium]